MRLAELQQWSAKSLIDLDQQRTSLMELDQHSFANRIGKYTRKLLSWKLHYARRQRRPHWPSELLLSHPANRIIITFKYMHFFGNPNYSILAKQIYPPNCHSPSEGINIAEHYIFGDQTPWRRYRPSAIPTFLISSKMVDHCSLAHPHIQAPSRDSIVSGSHFYCQLWKKSHKTKKRLEDHLKAGHP